MEKTSSTPKTSQRLNPTEMDDTLQRFQRCLEICLQHQTEDDQHAIVQFIEDLKIRIPAYSLRPDALQQLQTRIFQSKALTVFLFDTGFRFFTLVGDENHFLERLSRTVAQGLLIDGASAHSQIPHAIAQSCPYQLFTVAVPWYRRWFKPAPSPEVRLTQFLSHNKPLLLCYLIQLVYLTPAEPEVQ